MVTIEDKALLNIKKKGNNLIIKSVSTNSCG